jgi:hypothetical protein
MILLEFKDGTGIGNKELPIFINPEAVESLQPERPDSTMVRTKSYTYLVKGAIEDIAVALMLPDLAKMAGTDMVHVVDLLEKAGAES